MATKYSLTFKIENKPENMSVFILDSYLNTTTELSSEAIYDFDIDSNIPDSTNPKRFQLIFKTNVLSTDDYTFESQYMLYPNPSNGSRIIHIQTPYYSLNNAKVQVFDVTGKSMMSQDNVFIENGVVSLSASNLPDGLYIVKLKQNQNIKTFKFLKN
jgi:hypothetical protein